MKKQEKQNNSKLKIIPLGGLEQIGMNITAFEYEDSIIVVDCGLAFPEDDMYGVDLVIPDVTYLKENIDRSVSVITCNQVTGKVWDSYDSTVLCLICCRRMCILLGWNPWCPWAAIEKCIPGVVTGMICFRAFLPAGSYRTLHRRVSFLHIIDRSNNV